MWPLLDPPNYQVDFEVDPENYPKSLRDCKGEYPNFSILKTKHDIRTIDPNKRGHIVGLTLVKEYLEHNNVVTRQCTCKALKSIIRIHGNEDNVVCNPIDRPSLRETEMEKNLIRYLYEDVLLPHNQVTHAIEVLKLFIELLESVQAYLKAGGMGESKSLIDLLEIITNKLQCLY